MDIYISNELSTSVTQAGGQPIAKERGERTPTGDGQQTQASITEDRIAIRNRSGSAGVGGSDLASMDEAREISGRVVQSMSASNGDLSATHRNIDRERAFALLVG